MAICGSRKLAATGSGGLLPPASPSSAPASAPVQDLLASRPAPMAICGSRSYTATESDDYHRHVGGGVLAQVGRDECGMAIHGTGASQPASAFPPGVPTTWWAKGRDVNGDGVPDVVWYEPSSGQVATWLMHSPAAIGSWDLPGQRRARDHPGAVGDRGRQGDGRADLLWRQRVRRVAGVADERGG